MSEVGKFRIVRRLLSDKFLPFMLFTLFFAVLSIIELKDIFLS